MSGAPASGNSRGTGSRWSRFLGAGILPRVVVALIGAPLLVWIGWVGGWFFLAAVHLVILLGLREFYQLAHARGYGSYRTIGMIGGLGLALVQSLRPEWTNGAVTLLFFVVTVSELARRDGGRALAHAAVTLFGVIYVAWLGAHIVVLREWAPVAGPASAGLRALGFAVLMTWCYDTFAYMVGVAVGRHPLLERVSPKKSREGALGGLVMTGLFGYGASLWFAAPLFSPWEGALLGLVCAVAAQLGDLVESLFKRDAGLKDTADLLPGHGGVLDRFDSLLFTVPLVYYVLALGLVGTS